MATTKDETGTTKILVNVYPPLITLLKHRTDEVCLKRDAYLDKVLLCEAGYLRREITTPNSDKSKNYIADQFKQLRLKPLNLSLSQKTVDLINEVCKEKNVSRDVFVNRVFLLLTAYDSVIDSLFEEAIDIISNDYPNKLDFDEEIENIKNFFMKNVKSDEPENISGIERFYKSFETKIPTKRDRSRWAKLVETFEINNFVNNYLTDKERFSTDSSEEIGYVQYFLSHNIGTNNAFDTIEKFVTQTPFEKLRDIIFFTLEKKYKDFHKNTMFTYPFKKDALNKLPSHFDFLKTDNALGFNTFMTDDDVSVLEKSDIAFANDVISKISFNKLLEFAKKEKQLLDEEEKHEMTSKTDSKGEEL